MSSDEDEDITSVGLVKKNTYEVDIGQDSANTIANAMYKIVMHVPLFVFSNSGLLKFCKTMFLPESLLIIDEKTLGNFISVIETYYHNNKFSNFARANDVLMMTKTIIRLVLLEHSKLNVSRAEIFAAMISSLVCYLDHPGYTNAFLKDAKTPLSYLYNDTSILENHACATFFQLIKSNKEINVFRNLTSKQAKNSRSIIIKCVMYNDFDKHNDYFNSDKLKQLDDNFEDYTPEKAAYLMACIVHLAAISFLLRPVSITAGWQGLQSKEYNRETDIRRDLSMSIVKNIYMQTATDTFYNELLFLRKVESFVVFMSNKFRCLEPIYINFNNRLDYVENQFAYFNKMQNSLFKIEEK